MESTLPSVQKAADITGLVKLVIHLPRKQSFTLDIPLSDSLYEVRQFLTEMTEMFAYQNFQFVQNGRILNEFTELSTLNLEINDSTTEISIQFSTNYSAPYEEKSCKHHLRKVQEMLVKPALIHQFFGKEAKSIVEAMQPMEKKEDESKAQNDQKKEKTVVRKISLDAVIQGQFSSLKNIMQSTKPQKTILLVNHMILSGFNPVPQERKLQGDLLYLTIKTLEEFEFHITGQATGFFLNNSTSRTFNPTKKDKKVYWNLLELLQSISSLFVKNFEQAQKEEIGKYLIPSQQLYFNKPANSWVNFKNAIETRKINLNRLEESTLNLYGFDPTSIRDWNEELQLTKSVQREDLFQRLHYDKIINKINSDFIEAAIEGAKAIIDKNISPLNPMDAKYQQVYVYNQIFYSFASETPDSFKQEVDGEGTATISSANSDLRHLTLLHNLSIASLHAINTCLVDYKGYRLIAQTIIPGILSADTSKATQYGSIDSGKTIQSSEDFQPLFLNLAKQFHLIDSLTYKDASDKVHILHGSLAVKGIKGTDGRKYALDLLRLGVRDANYINCDNEACCQIRQELLENFITWKTMTEPEKEWKWNPSLLTVSTMVIDEKVKEEQYKDLEMLSQFIINQGFEAIVQEFETYLTLQYSALINLSAENVLFVDSSSIASIFHSIGINMRFFLFILYLLLIDILKMRGDIQADTSGALTSLAILLEKAVIVKSLKHVFREIFRESNGQYQAQVIAHFLNCVFSKLANKQQLDEKKIAFNLDESFELLEKSYKDQQQQQQKIEEDNNNAKEQLNKKKNKKKRKNQKKGPEEKIHQLSKDEITIELPVPASLKLTPTQIWEKVCYIALKRYEHVLPSKYTDLKAFLLQFTKTAILRDFCKTVGISIQLADYDISDNYFQKLENIADEKEAVATYGELPFQSFHILEVQPIVKHVEFYSSDIKLYIELGQKYFLENKLTEALDYFSAAIQLQTNLHGTMNKQIATCYQYFVQIYFRLDQIEKCIYYQKQIYQIYKQIYGRDHFTTASAMKSLALCHFKKGNKNEAEKWFLQATYIYFLIGGEAFPESYSCLQHLANLYLASGKTQLGISCLIEALQRKMSVFGEQHFQLIPILKALAQSHYIIKDQKKANEYIEMWINILKNLDEKLIDPQFKEQSIKEAQIFKDSLTAAFQNIYQEQVKDLNLQSSGCYNYFNFYQSFHYLEKNRKFGQNEKEQAQQQQPQQQQQQQQQIQQNKKNEILPDRETLLQRLKRAKQNIKYGRKPQQGDIFS